MTQNFEIFKLEYNRVDGINALRRFIEKHPADSPDKEAHQEFLNDLLSGVPSGYLRLINQESGRIVIIVVSDNPKHRAALFTEAACKFANSNPSLH